MMRPSVRSRSRPTNLLALTNPIPRAPTQSLCAPSTDPSIHLEQNPSSPRLCRPPAPILSLAARSCLLRPQALARKKYVRTPYGRQVRLSFHELQALAQALTRNSHPCLQTRASLLLFHLFRAAYHSQSFQPQKPRVSHRVLFHSCNSHPAPPAPCPAWPGLLQPSTSISPPSLYAFRNRLEPPSPLARRTRTQSANLDGFSCTAAAESSRSAQCAPRAFHRMAGVLRPQFQPPSECLRGRLLSLRPNFATPRELRTKPSPACPQK